MIEIDNMEHETKLDEVHQTEVIRFVEVISPYAEIFD